MGSADLACVSFPWFSSSLRSSGDATIEREGFEERIMGPNKQDKRWVKVVTEGISSLGPMRIFFFL